MFEITTVPFDLDEALSLLAKLSARKDFWEYKQADGTQTFRGNKLPDLGRYVLDENSDVWVDLCRCPSLDEATMFFDNAPELSVWGPYVYWDLKAKSGDDCDIALYAGKHWLGLYYGNIYG